MSISNLTVLPQSGQLGDTAIWSIVPRGEWYLALGEDSGPQRPRYRPYGLRGKACAQPTVDEYRGASHEACFIGSDEGDHVRDFGGGRDPTHRVLRKDARLGGGWIGLHVDPLLDQMRPGPPGADRVDPDLFRPVVEGKTAGQPDQARFRG